MSKSRVSVLYLEKDKCYKVIEDIKDSSNNIISKVGDYLGKYDKETVTKDFFTGKTYSTYVFEKQNYDSTLLDSSISYFKEIPCESNEKYEPCAISRRNRKQSSRRRKSSRRSRRRM